MPKRDRSRAEGTGAGPCVSRRAVLTGVGVALCSPPASWAYPAPLRVGMVEGLDLAPDALAREAVRLCGRPGIAVPFPGWGVLRDHLEGGSTLIDAAVLPAAVPSGPLGSRAAAVWHRVGRAPRRVGVPVRHPASDAAIGDLLDSQVDLYSLPAAALWANLAAGLLDAAVLLQEPTGMPATGLASWRLTSAQARGLLPPLRLVLSGVAT